MRGIADPSGLPHLPDWAMAATVALALHVGLLAGLAGGVFNGEL